MSGNLKLTIKPVFFSNVIEAAILLKKFNLSSNKQQSILSEFSVSPELSVLSKDIEIATLLSQYKSITQSSLSQSAVQPLLEGFVFTEHIPCGNLRVFLAWDYIQNKELICLLLSLVTGCTSVLLRLALSWNETCLTDPMLTSQ